MLSRRSILVRQAFDAYRCHERAMLEAVLAADFRFTSPYDDAIDRDTYFERCWPNHENILEHELERLVEIDGAVIVTYCCVSKTGRRSRNTEIATGRSARLVSPETGMRATVAGSSSVLMRVGASISSVSDSRGGGTMWNSVT
jgi:hypothetical protein